MAYMVKGLAEVVPEDDGCCFCQGACPMIEVTVAAFSYPAVFTALKSP